ncbi:hypothetical protein Tco_1533457 [Tanacetum coccineum]
MVELLLEVKLPQALQALCERLNKYIQKKQEEKNIAEEQAAKISSQYWKPSIYYDNDDDEGYSIQVSEFFKKSPITITPVLPTIEPEDSLSMRDEHLSTIPEKESDKVIKSSVENLVPIPSESKDLTNYESECDMPVCDDSSSKNESLDDIEFAGELTPIDPIPPGIVEADFDPKEDIRLIEKLLNDDSSPHSPEELNSKIPDAIIESFSPSPIPIEDRGCFFLEELLNDDSISLPKYESFHIDFYNVPSSPRPPEKPLDDDVYFDIEPDTGVLTTKVVNDIFDNLTRKLYVHVPNVLPILPTLYPVFDTLLPFSSENEDKVFNPGILISKEEKSPRLLSHRGFKVFQHINDFENPMMIYGGDIPILDDCPDFEDSRARRTDLSQKDKNKANMDKTEHENGMSAEKQSQSRSHLKWANPDPLNGHGYAVSSLVSAGMDTAYWSSETIIFKISSFKLQNTLFDVITPSLLTVPVSVISESSPIYSTVIPQSIPSFTPLPPQSTPTPPPTTEATNPQSALPNFASVFQFNNRVTALEKEVVKHKKDPLHTQVTALVDDHLDARIGATRDEFMNRLSSSITARVTEQESSQPQSSYEAAATLTEFELKKIMIDKKDKSESYLAAPEHRECYEGLIKSYDLDKTIFSTYGKVYSLKRSQKDKDKDEDSLAGSNRGLKKRKTSKDAELAKGPKAKESQSGSSKGDKSQSKSFGKSVQSKEPEFEVTDSNMPQDQDENPGNDDEKPKEKVASKRDWFIKPTQPREPTDPDWNVGKTSQQRKHQSWLMTLASSTEKPSKTFDELMTTLIEFSAFIMNGLKIKNLTQETLLGPAFRLLKGKRSNYAELDYDFEECYKALSEKLDWENPEGGDYPFDLIKPLPLVMSRNRQKVPVDYFFNNDLKYLQGGILTMTYTTSLTKTKATQYDLPGIEDMTFYGYARGLESSHDVHSTKRILAVTQVEVMRKHVYRYLKEIVVRRADNDLYRFKEGDFPRLRINNIEDMLLLKKINVTKLETTKSDIKKRDPYTPYQDPQGFIYVDNNGRNRLMRSDELYKFGDRTLTGRRTPLDDITKNIRMEYLPKRRWSTLEKKRANIMIKAIAKQLKERR